MQTNDLLISLTEKSGVSGYEQTIQAQIAEIFRQFTNDVKVDTLGNVIAKISGIGDQCRPSIMVTAHADEIGFMVSKIEKGGFLRVLPIGGVDPRTVLAQEVIVHGREDLLGIFGAKPPHLLQAEDFNKVIPLDELFIDLGMDEQRIRELVHIGDIVTIRRKTIPLLNNHMAAKAMDDRSGIVLMIEMMKQLKRLHINADIYVVATVQEEIGVRGAITSSYSILPDIGIAIDVTHGDMPGVASDLVFELGKGPVIGYGPNIHSNIYDLLVKTAKDENIPYQIEISQGPTGTDARAIQVTQAGIATGLLSIPLRYMHTSVETLNTKDIKHGAKLLALFIERVDKQFVEELVCY
jgi:endoglucanase